MLLIQWHVRHRILVAVLLIVGLSGLSAGWAGAMDQRARSAQRFQVAMAPIDSLLLVGQADQAAAEARSRLPEFGEHPLWGNQIRSRLGLALLRTGRPEQALPLLEDGVRTMPDDAMVHRNLAAALMAMGRRGRALTEFQQAVGLDPGNPDLRLEFGQTLLEMRAYQESRKELLLARQLCGGCLAADQALARLFLATDDDAAAIPYLQRLFAVAKDSCTRRELLGALHRTGGWQDLTTILEALAGPPLQTDEARLLAEADWQLGNRERPLAWVLARENPEAPEARPAPFTARDDALFWGTVALNLLEGGYLQESLAASDLAIGLDPSNTTYRHNRVAALQQLGRQEEAAKEWSRLQELTGNPQAQGGED